MKITRIMIIVGWLAASYALFNVIFRLDFHWNFFNWLPKWDVKAALDGISILAILVCIWFLAKATRDRVSQIVSVLVCLLLAGFAVVYVFPTEPLTGGFLGRTIPSPLWYRGCISLLLCLPSVFWLWKVWHHSSHNDVAS
ncbi:MAG: hypothetical protein ABSG80_10955 [Verrucomicrobiota bacterium]|jgi:hypothetical protein